MAKAFGSQHTSTFPEFLSKAGISLLVSTYQSGKLIMLRHQGGVLNTHFIDMEKPMGITLHDDNLVVGTAYQVSYYYNVPDVAPKVEPLNTHNACYLPRKTHITGNIDIHEMAFNDENELWLVNTKMSCLCTLSDEHSVIPRWRPPFISSYDLTDRCHLNGLAMKHGKPTYVTALGITNNAAGWRKNKASGGMLMDIRNNKMIASGLSMPHSPRWHQDQLWVLESGVGSLSTVDLSIGKLHTIIELPGFTRGLDFIGRYAIIGLSQVRETAVFAGLPLTERCEERQCGVYIVDIIENKLIAFVNFSGDVQEIFSVQILPSVFPAVLSMDDPLLRTSYSLPDEVLSNLGEIDPTRIQLEKGISLHRHGEIKKAINVYQNLLSEKPDNTRALFNLGLIYLESAQWKQASDLLQQLINKEPNNAEAHNNLGQAWSGLKKWEKAKASFVRAINIDQQYALAHVNKSLLLLRQGEFSEGWKEFEWRWKIPGMKSLDCPQPQLKNVQTIDELQNKTILVHTEQSDSDIIQFARFLPLFKKASLCKRLIILCPESFRLFFKSIEVVDEVRLPSKLQADSFDAYVPIMSLPHILDITINSLPAKTPYWKILTEVVVPSLQSNYAMKVGLLWNSEIQTKQEVNTPSLLDLTKLENIQFYSLQTPISEEEKKLLNKHNTINLEQELISYAHTGAIIKQLDLVICVESPLAHLSASLGKPTWVLLDDNPDWRWMNQQEKNLWYPDMKLFYQQADNNWVKVVNDVRLELSDIQATF